MTQTFPIYITPLQAVLISMAIEEYQSDFEAELNGFEIRDRKSIETLSEYNSVAVECELIRKSIDQQFKIL